MTNLSLFLWQTDIYGLYRTIASRRLVTSARHVGLSRSAMQYLFTPKRDASVRSLYLSWLRIGELVSKSAHIGNLVSKSLHRHNIFITNYRVASRQLVTSARHVGSSRCMKTHLIITLLI